MFNRFYSGPLRTRVKEPSLHILGIFISKDDYIKHISLEDFESAGQGNNFDKEIACNLLIFLNQSDKWSKNCVIFQNQNLMLIFYVFYFAYLSQKFESHRELSLPVYDAIWCLKSEVKATSGCWAKLPHFLIKMPHLLNQRSRPHDKKCFLAIPQRLQNSHGKHCHQKVLSNDQN